MCRCKCGRITLWEILVTILCIFAPLKNGQPPIDFVGGKFIYD